MCGYSFLTKEAAIPSAPAGHAAGGPPTYVSAESAGRKHEVEIGVGTGFRFGIGFMVAVVIFSLVLSLISSLVFAGLLNSLLRPFAN